VRRPQVVLAAQRCRNHPSPVESRYVKWIAAALLCALRLQFRLDSRPLCFVREAFLTSFVSTSYVPACGFYNHRQGVLDMSTWGGCERSCFVFCVRSAVLVCCVLNLSESPHKIVRYRVCLETDCPVPRAVRLWGGYF